MAGFKFREKFEIVVLAGFKFRENLPRPFWGLLRPRIDLCHFTNLPPNLFLIILHPSFLKIGQFFSFRPFQPIFALCTIKFYIDIGSIGVFGYCVFFPVILDIGQVITVFSCWIWWMHYFAKHLISVIKNCSDFSK